MFWAPLSKADISARVFQALATNQSYRRDAVLGLPGSHLDSRVFPEAPFLRESPFLSVLRENPNHIGCHTGREAEPSFAGTQELERELLRLCAEEILACPAGGYEGYVASGGTEANLQALWANRNRFGRELGVRTEEVAVLCSEDTHYSVAKGIDLLGLSPAVVRVEADTRAPSPDEVERVIEAACARGARCFVVVLNMGTTMFGSVDDPDRFLAPLERRELPFAAHVDAAFGGFIYPFTAADSRLSFADRRLGSFTLDAHKMLQAPYGTGIFLARRGLLAHTATEAGYIPGGDHTLCGSRSGANAVAVWMILCAYGSAGGRAFVQELVSRTDWLCERLRELGRVHYRHPDMNVVALRADAIPPELAELYSLVPDTHRGAPGWWKVVVMEHVTRELLGSFVARLASQE